MLTTAQSLECMFFTKIRCTQKGGPVARRSGSAQIIREEDESFIAFWGVHKLHSAFQPLFVFHAGQLKIVGYEGLLRPFRGAEAIGPGQFFSGLQEEDRFEVENLTRNLHLMNAGRSLDGSASIFVNFDPSLFVNRKMIETALMRMRAALDHSGIEPERVVCEITEQKTHSEPTLEQFVDTLRQHGFRVAVDDYGVEHSDMHRILTLRPDIVKFDAQWLTGLMRSDGGSDLLFEMVRRFTEMGIQTVFEGLEEGWQVEVAERAGVSMVQGFVLARPELAPADFSAFGRRRERRGE